MVVNDVFFAEIRDYRDNHKKRIKTISLTDRAMTYIKELQELLEADMKSPKVELNDSMLVEGLVTIMFNNIPKEGKE